MRVGALDSDALRMISPKALAAYAKGSGWQFSETYGEHSDVYVGQRHPEIIIPRTEQLADYSAVVARLIEIFAELSSADQMATYRDLVGADKDVVRVRALDNHDDGSVPIDAGVSLVTEARELLLAAACSVDAVQPVYRPGANKKARDYMDRVRLGQTEHGSFVVTILAPVTPQIQLPLDPSWIDLKSEPFDRRVTRRLMVSLVATRRVVEQAVTHGENGLEEAIKDGVSANLCEAVAELTELSRNVDISVTWAKTRPEPEPRRHVMFSQNDSDVLREVSRNLRARLPKPDVELVGFVHELKRDHDEFEGSIKLKANVDGRIQTVSAILDQVSYKLAVRAHGDKLLVISHGDLERIGQRWQLTNATLTAAEGGDSPRGGG